MKTSCASYGETPYGFTVTNGGEVHTNIFLEDTAKALVSAYNSGYTFLVPSLINDDRYYGKYTTDVMFYDNSANYVLAEDSAQMAGMYKRRLYQNIARIRDEVNKLNAEKFLEADVL
ncbi:MAG: hypothetical protein CMN60_20245 [Sphingobium sp.]|nr:hypothetical protein [Sphingobium sp.]|tara:strand:- start:16878 stop:17228 length:351 start_codon:yes stop_codon:yes gene_type:complete